MKISKQTLRTLILSLLIVTSIFIFSACDNDNNPTIPNTSQTCQHQWIDADCFYPKTCRICNKIEGEALGHNFIEATCTTPKTCTRCTIKEGVSLGHTEVVDVAIAPTCTEKGLTEGKHCSVCNQTLIKQDEIPASGHKWNMPTCITPKMCPICKLTEGEPYGHTFENGECVYCYEDDPDYVKPTLTSTTHNVNLTDNSDIAYITMIGGETIVYDIDDTDIVLCEWGDWDGDTIPLTFIPISSGKTFVIVYIQDYDISIQINVTVEMPEPTLTFNEIGKEYKYYPSYGSLKYNVNIVNSASYTVTKYTDGTIKFNVELLVANIEYNVSYGYINIDYELYNEDGVCVDTGYVWVDCRYIGRNYVYETTFYGLKSGNYTLVFYDTYA